MAKTQTNIYIKTLRFSAIIISIVVTICIALIGVNYFVIQPTRYSDAVELLESGEYEEAIDAFKDLGNYRNSEIKLNESRYLWAIQQEANEEYQIAISTFETLGDYRNSLAHVEKCNYILAKQFALDHDYVNALEHIKKAGKLASEDEIAVLVILNSKVGDNVKFGVYEQDNIFSNGPELIEWTVINNNNGEVTLLSNKNLECKKYNEIWKNTSWEDCTLRNWLNNDFYNSAFNDNKKKVLKTYKTTGDKVYILSANEWNECGISKGTLNSYYAISHGIYNDNGVGWSWLRDEGIGDDHAQEIDCVGEVNTFGSFVDCDNTGVRPVIIICGGNMYE